MIKNYEIPAGRHAGSTLLVSMLALASSMYLSEIMGTYWWVILGIAVMVASLLIWQSKSHEILEANRQAYIQHLDNCDTTDLTQALEDPKTTDVTRKFILSYLNEKRTGWASITTRRDTRSIGI